ncbi:MAG: hypothetical protein Q8O67_33210 [Deltaproteobacteria bacterium]|nr:hypothetical protein [Deltaproteobacteria bacterium]
MPLFRVSSPILPLEGINLSVDEVHECVGTLISIESLVATGGDLACLVWCPASESASLVDRRGSICRVVGSAPDGMSLEAISRARVIAYTAGAYLTATTELFPQPDADKYEVGSPTWVSLMDAVAKCGPALEERDELSLLEYYMKYGGRDGGLPWAISRALRLSPIERQRLLQEDELERRLTILIGHLEHFSDAL